MKKTKKPKVCDFCMEEDKLHWSKKFGGWSCDLCKDELKQKDEIKEYEREESLKAMLEEEDYNEEDK